MKKPGLVKVIIAVFILLPLVLYGEIARIRAMPANQPARQSFDADKCRIILEKTAARLDWGAPEIYVNTYDDGSVACQITHLEVGEGAPSQFFVHIAPGSSYCGDCAKRCQNPENDCECVDVHGYTGQLSSMNTPNSLQLTFCDPFCDLYFDIQTQTEGERPLDPRPVGEALYYSALEMNCCQPVMDNPSSQEAPLDMGEPPLPVDSGVELPEAPGETFPPEDLPDELCPPEGLPSGDREATADLGSLARIPIVPLAEAVAGTILGWLVTTWINTGKTLDGLVATIKGIWTPAPGQVSATPAPSDVSAGPPPVKTQGWDSWEMNLPPQAEDPLVAEPTIPELRADPMDVYQVKDAVIQSYRDDIPQWRQANIDPGKMHILDKQRFDGEYQKAFKTPNTDGTTGFADSNTYEIFIDQENAYTYTPVHETIHLCSNPEYRGKTSRMMDESTTEYFTKKIATQKQGAHLTVYDEGVKVIGELEKNIGEQLLRKAFFGEGKEAIDELARAVDGKYGEGAFARISQLVDENKPLKARALLRGAGLSGESVK